MPRKKLTEIRLPLDIDKSRWDEIAQREIECPVRTRRQRHCLAADSQGIQLWWIDPADRAPRRRIGRHKQIRARNDGLAWRAGDAGRRCRRVVDTLGASIVSVAAEQACVGEQPDSHERCSDQQGWSTAPAVNEQESRHGHDDVDNILDR